MNMFATHQLGFHDVFSGNSQCHLSWTFLALSGTVKHRFISFACGVFKSTRNRILLVSTRGWATSVEYHAMSVNTSTQIQIHCFQPYISRTYCFKVCSSVGTCMYVCLVCVCVFALVRACVRARLKVCVRAFARIFTSVCKFCPCL